MLILRSESIATAAAALAGRTGALLQEAVHARGEASLLVPGGRTPVPLFRALRDADVQWQHVAVGLTDERWVPSDNADSNARLVRTELMCGGAAAAKFAPLFHDGHSVAQGALLGWRALSALRRPFDVVVLGMGEDGHIASLFPGAAGVDAALDVHAVPACVPMRAPTVPHERLSLNLAALADARHLFLLIAGESKLALIEDAGSRPPLPVDALLALPRPEPVVYWSP